MSETKKMDDRKNFKSAKKRETACESCMYYDEDNEDCRMELDEDELINFALRRTGNCPYYRFYDEYKSVRKQN